MILCEECLFKNNTFDYIRFNEINYFCSIHKLKNKFYCSNCGNFFCEKCKNLSGHIIIKLEEKDLNNKCTEILEQLNMLSKFKNRGFFGLLCKDIKCKINNNNVNKEINDLKSFFKKNSYSFDNHIYKLKQNLKIYLQNIQNFILMKELINLNSKIIELEKDNIKSKLIVETLIKELNEKNEFVFLLKERNVCQHLIFNIIKKEHKVFENIKPDFRILYESYLYLNYDKDKKEIIKSQIEDIFNKVE